MKKLITTLTLALTLGAFAQTADEAAALYTKRGQRVTRAEQSNAYKAAKIYEAVAAKASTDLEKATNLTKSAQAYYFAAEQILTNKIEDGDASAISDLSKTEKETIMNIHDLGVKNARTATALLEDKASTDEEKLQLALSYYRTGSNLGKWAEAKGVVQSLKRWPELRDTMEKILKLDGGAYKYVEAYGANRILGRAYYKLPSISGGDKELSLKLLKEAFENTKDGGSISTYSVNNTYYAETLISLGKDEEARVILTDLVDLDDVADYNPNRIPETTVDQVIAQNILDEM